MTCETVQREDGTLYHGNVEAVTGSRDVASLSQGLATGGHFGRDKTYKKTQARYWRKGMKREIEEYIQNCDKFFEQSQR